MTERESARRQQQSAAARWIGAGRLSLDEARAELERFERFCAHLGLRIEPFQRLILLEVFRGRRKLLVLIPRGNGKTTLFAALALWHLLRHPRPRIYVAAAARDQAEILFNEAWDFAQRHPSLAKRVKKRQRMILRKDGAGFLKVISSDAGRQHGLMPTLILVDELHAHKNGDLYVAMNTAMGKNVEAQMVTISTEGHDEDALLAQMRRAALELEHVTREGPRLTVARDDRANFAMLRWACTTSDNLRDPRILKLANPASFVRLEFLEEQIHDPGLHPAELACFHANVPHSGIDSWLDEGDWDDCATSDAVIPRGAEDVVLAIDMAKGRTMDRAAVVALWLRPDGRVVLRAWIVDPPAPGVDISYESIEQLVIDARDVEGWHVRTVVHDGWRMDRSGEILEGHGFQVLEVPPSPKRLSDASVLLYAGIRNRVFAHTGDRRFKAHVEAGTIQLTEFGWRLRKDPKKKLPIDALSALLIGYDELVAEEGVSVYERRGLLST